MIYQIEELMKYETAGDPIKGTKWTRTTTGKISSLLNDSLGISICKNTVGKLLKDMKYSLRVNQKKLSGTYSDDRDKQFEIIRNIREEFEKNGDPIISVDTKKKEMVGLFKNPGSTWCQKAILVNDHDFRSCAKGMANPYGLYELLLNLGYLFIGTSYDTPEFAVNSIVKWWYWHGRRHYSNSRKLLILADAGGSNGYRSKVWKYAIQNKICDYYGLSVRVSHYPTGASKWNPVEHRLFSEVSKNWAGRPLDSYETIVNYAKTTKTKTGLRVKSYLDTKKYEKGLTVSDEEMEELLIIENNNLGKWNYTIKPR